MFPETLTARAVVYDNGSREMGCAELTARLREVGSDHTLHTAARALGDLVRGIALPRIAEAVDGLLDIDLGDAAVAGWRRCDHLRSAPGAAPRKSSSCSPTKPPTPTARTWRSSSTGSPPAQSPSSSSSFWRSSRWPPPSATAPELG
ncbi:hypothetical protein AB0J47_28990 [Nocardia sp. NPDC049737]|uniref:hypothetical protein n=1 Tax=Nocardia sp. NPDC049737 TaxID=3154358 RepID=UPI0034353199